MTRQQRKQLAKQLFVAIKLNNMEEVVEIIDKGADVNAVVLNHGETPLMGATQSKNTEMMKLLMNSGASPNLGMDNGTTPIHYAAKEASDVSVLELLLKYGGNPTVKDKQVCISLHVSCLLYFTSLTFNFQSLVYGI